MNLNKIKTKDIMNRSGRCSAQMHLCKCAGQMHRCAKLSQSADGRCTKVNVLGSELIISHW